MVIFILEPYLNDSHRYWGEGIIENSEHEVKLFALPAKHFKWRMQASAISLAEQIKNEKEPDHIIISDMCNAALLRSLLPKTWTRVKTHLYFHENQITFPWNSSDQDVKKRRENHYGFINYTSALAVDSVFFNSHFHKSSFIEALPDFLSQFPDHKNLESIQTIKDKSYVWHIGIYSIPPIKDKRYNETPTILWNHRWEEDKNVKGFVKALHRIKDKNLDFKLIITGKSGRNYPEEFDQLKEEFKDHISYIGYAESKSEYHELVSQTHIIPVTSEQEFFGISLLEAVSAVVYPLMPKRLVYPEHFSDEELFYDSEDELYEKLEDLVKNWNTTKNYIQTKAEALAESVQEKYNWEKSQSRMNKLLAPN